MSEEWTLVRIHKDVLRRLKVVAEREKRTVPNQIAYFTELAEQAQPVKEPTHPTTQEPQA